MNDIFDHFLKYNLLSLLQNNLSLNFGCDVPLHCDQSAQHDGAARANRSFLATTNESRTVVNTAQWPIGRPICILSLRAGG